MNWRHFGSATAIAFGLLALSACTLSGSRPLANYEPDPFGASMYTRHYLGTPAQTCEAARRALLSQGYMVTEAKPDHVTAHKYFQPDPEHHVQIEFSVVCAADGPDQSLAFASATQDQYVPKPASNSASVGVGAFGSLSLPFQSGLDSLVKISSETVTNEDVYDQLFTLMSGYLTSVEREDKVKAERPNPPTTPGPTAPASPGKEAKSVTANPAAPESNPIQAKPSSPAPSAAPEPAEPATPRTDANSPAAASASSPAAAGDNDAPPPGIAQQITPHP